jgi:hypothetical protein
LDAEQTGFDKLNREIEALASGITPDGIVRLIGKALGDAINEALKPFLEELQFRSCSAVPQDGRLVNLSGAAWEGYKLQRECEILRGENLDG